MRLRFSEITITTALTLITLAALAQAVSFTKTLNAQAAQHQANAIYSNELLTYKLTNKKQQTRKQKKYIQKVNTELSRRQAISTIGRQDASDASLTYDKLIVADLTDMLLHTYQNGRPVDTVPILSKGKIGSRWETPAGLYEVATKEVNHFSSIGKVNMPYSMQFFGNFFIHGWPTKPNGTKVPTGYSGGCIRLATTDSQKIFNFAKHGTKILIVNSKKSAYAPSSKIGINDTAPRGISASSYIIADVDTGAVYAQKNIDKQLPIASVSKLLTALTANAIIRYDAQVPILVGGTIEAEDYRGIHRGAKLKAVDTIFPLLMESNNAVAHALAKYYGTSRFIATMNKQAKAIGMAHTSMSDASGLSPKNKSTARDLYKLARYLYNNSAFILEVTSLKSQKVTSDRGSYYITNHNHFANNPNFIGGKTGYTPEAKETMLSLFTANIDGTKKTIAIIILGSSERQQDVTRLYNWFGKHAEASKNTNEIFSEGGVTHIKGIGGQQSFAPLSRKQL